MENKIKLFSIALLVTLLFFEFISPINATSNIYQIGVRQQNGKGELYNTLTGIKFIPRGNNYIILANFLDPNNGCSGPYHSTFNVAVSNGCDTVFYDSFVAETELTRMQQSGYNTVRVFINERLIGSPNGGLDKAYLTNVADFLSKAKAHHIYVILTLPYIPLRGGYYPAVASDFFTGENWYYLDSNAIAAKQKYITDFINGLKSIGADFSPILAYEIENEQYFSLHDKPLSLNSGFVTPANGKQYNLADSNSRVKMLSEGSVFYVNSVTQTVHNLEPKALITIGFFPPSSDPSNRQVAANETINTSAADFIDIHAYPGWDTLNNTMNSFGIINGVKPLVMGEYGAYKSQYPDTYSAAITLRDWQVNSCQLGFSGWVLWTWNTPGDIWNNLDNGGAINGILAPIIRADPCNPNATFTPGDFNGDGHVNYSDFQLLTASFGNPYTIFDFNNLVANYGK